MEACIGSGRLVGQRVGPSSGVDGDIFHLEHASVAVQSGRVGVAWPYAAHGQIHNHVQGRMGQGTPHGLVANGRARDGKKDGAVLFEIDRLGSPVVACAVNLDSINVPIVVCGHASLVACTRARLANGGRAVDRCVRSGDAIDHFHHVDFTTLRPVGAVADRVTHHPDSRPHALGLGLRVASHASSRLNQHLFASRGCPGRLGLDSSRSPSRWRLPRDHLDCAATRQLQVSRCRGVGLQLRVCVDGYKELARAGRRVHAQDLHVAIFHTSVFMGSPAFPANVSENTTVMPS